MNLPQVIDRKRCEIRPKQVPYLCVSAYMCPAANVSTAKDQSPTKQTSSTAVSCEWLAKHVPVHVSPILPEYELNDELKSVP